MANTPSTREDFLTELHRIVADSMADEQFGVSELAEAMHMSRSNLLRKVKKETGLSASQLISQIRLRRAHELLTTTTMNVSEVGHEVGFNSASYFIKCFGDYYGYSPGEAKQRIDAGPMRDVIPEGVLPEEPAVETGSAFRRLTPWLVAAFVVVAGVVWFLFRTDSAAAEKSIAVLPFKNESSDSSNLYLINGLMDATLNNLQRIDQLTVISRTTAEKYRNTSKSIPEIGEELHVNYFVEGSGQKLGDRILLNIQLIEATTDKHLWAKQYRRQTHEIFELQQEIARDIAEEIEVIIRPEDRRLIERRPTDDLIAYDYYLKARDLFNQSTRTSLEAAEPLFQKAIESDPEFGLAYANLAMVYYYLDFFQFEKKFVDRLTECADKAMLFDGKSSESLVAKGLDYAGRKQHKKAIPFFERALEYDPNSGLLYHFLNEFYSLYVPNPHKHLTYALKKVKIDLPGGDSATLGFDYFHVSNALFEAGFLDEALHYSKRALQYDRNGYFSGYFHAYMVNMKTNDVANMKRMLLQELERDTNRFDIVQEIGKVSFLMRDYPEAAHYYERFLRMQKNFGLNLYQTEYLRVALAFKSIGDQERARQYTESFRQYAETDSSMYKHLHRAYYFANANQTKRAIEEMQKFSKEDNFSYPVVCLADDPLVDPIVNEPGFKAAMKTIKEKFDRQHERIEELLKETEMP